MSKKKDTRLDFYFENKLIMSATAKEFIQMGIFQQDDTNKTTEEENVQLQIGDRFTLADFPIEGNTIIVRVFEMKIGNKFENGDFIKYYLEEYQNK